MRKTKQILAAILAAVLLVGSPMTSVQAGNIDGISEETTIEAETSTEEMTSETESLSEEETSEELSEETSEETGTTQEYVSETETDLQEEPVSETVPLEEESIPDTTEEMETEIVEEDTEASPEDTSVLACKEYWKNLEIEANNALQPLIEEKPMYALVYLTDAYEVKEAASFSSTTVASLKSGHTVEILGVGLDLENTPWDEDGVAMEMPEIWYKVGFYLGETYQTGYVQKENLAYSDEVLLQWESEYWAKKTVDEDVAFYEDSSFASETDMSDVEKFPTSYQPALRRLKEAHPNWTFVPMEVNKDFTTSVRKQIGNYSWIYYNQPAEFRGSQINSSWYYASEAGVRYYMDPRNFLNQNDIFMFEQNTFNASYHSEAALQSFLNGTFMKGVIPDAGETRTYANVIYNAGKSRGISPFNLAARITQEQGVNGTSAMISGTYAGFEGYYNHFNIGASGETNTEVLKNGLTYAKKSGWNTRYKSITGGSNFIGNGYILKGQDTLYLQKFDITKDSDFHQYMQNIMAPLTEGRFMRDMYVKAGALDSKFVFKIPVFLNMGGLEYKMTLSKVTLEKGTTKTLTIKENGYSFDNTKAEFRTSDAGVATVSDAGVITAVGNGDATITATIETDGEEFVLTCKVTVITKLQSISLDVSEVTLYRDDAVNGTIDIQVSYFPADTTDDRTVTYKTSKSSVATVKADSADNSKATITAVGEGTATITATVGDKKATCIVTVEVPMTEASLNKNTLELFAGKQEKLLVNYSPIDTTDNTQITWTSDNPEIAKVENGTVTAVSEGSTNIRAAIGPFTGEEEALTCQVIVGKCEVIFMDAEEQPFYEEKVSYGSSLSELETDTVWNMTALDGKTFLGWYTEKNGGGVEVTKDTLIYDHAVFYPYYRESATGFSVKPIGTMTYTGNAIKPMVYVYDEDTLLTAGKDYTLTYKNNKKVNDGSVQKTAPQVIVKGKGAYTGSQTVYFKIAAKSLEDGDIQAQDVLTAYNGKTQKLSPVVTRDGKKLKKNTDYTLTYPQEGKAGAYVRSGTYPVTITGKGGYSGSVTVQIEITKRTLITKASLKKIGNIEYDGTEKEPGVALSYKKYDLKEGTDYLLSYSHNQEIGTATVIITGIGNYIGTRTTTFKITGTAMSKAKISGITKKEYTGSPITQRIKTDISDTTEGVLVTDKEGNLLVEGTDYTVRYEKNINKGTAYMYFVGKGNYSGTVKKSFAITAYNIKENKQDYEEGKAFTDETGPLEVVYDKGGSKPSVTLMFKGTPLVEKVDYTLSYKNNTAVNDATITITGKGNFTGKVTKSFTIVEKALTHENDIQITAIDAEYKNKKNAWKIKPVLTDRNGKKLSAGTDYDKNPVYTYASDVTLTDGTIRYAGEAVQETDIPMPGELFDAKIKVTVTGIKNYKGSISTVYRITPASISKASVKIAKKTYIGEDVPVTLTQDDITVTLKGVPLTEKDYEIVSYQNNTKKGTAKVTLRGVGNYGGTKTVSFTITAKKILWWQNAEETVSVSFAEAAPYIYTGYDTLYYRLPELKINSEKLTFDTTEAWQYTLKGKKKGQEEQLTLVQKGTTFYLNASKEAQPGWYTLSLSPQITDGENTAIANSVSLSVYVTNESPALRVSKEKLSLNNLYVQDSDELEYGVYKWKLKEDSVTLQCVSHSAEDTEKFIISRAENTITYSTDENTGKLPETGTYQFALNAQIEIAGTEDLANVSEDSVVIKELPQRTFTVQVESEPLYDFALEKAAYLMKISSGRIKIPFSLQEGIVIEKATVDLEDFQCVAENEYLLLQDSKSSEREAQSQVNPTVTLYLTDGNHTVRQSIVLTITYSTYSELELLLQEEDRTELSQEERLEIRSAYEDNLFMNAYDKKVIEAANWDCEVDFSDVKIACLGDSITAGGGLKEADMGYAYPNVLENRLQAGEVYQLGYGGYAISRYWEPTTLHNVYENIPADSDIIIVQAGINDCYAGNEGNIGSIGNLYAQSTFFGDTNMLMEALKEDYPNAEIIFLTPCDTITNTTYITEYPLPDMLPLKRYVDAIKVIAQKNDVMVIDNYNINLLNSYDENILNTYMKDGVHPNKDGHVIMGEHLAAELIRMQVEGL